MKIILFVAIIKLWTRLLSDLLYRTTLTPSIEESSFQQLFIWNADVKWYCRHFFLCAIISATAVHLLFGEILNKIFECNLDRIHLFVHMNR